MTNTATVPPPSMALNAPLRLLDNPVRDRYELWSGEQLIGVEGYELTLEGDVILLHTVVMERYGRSGFARAMVAGVLDDLASQGRKAVPICSYVREFVTRFPRYAGVVTPVAAGM